MHLSRLTSCRLVAAAAASTALAALALAAGCATQGGGVAASRAPSGDSSGADAHAATAFVLWAHPESGPATSRWFDESGREVGRGEGVWIASAEQLFRVSSRERVAPGTPCDGVGEADERTRAWLVAESADGGAARALSHPTLMEDEPGSSQQAAWPRGSIGSTLIYVDELSAYYCGAHGSTTATFAAVDVATGTSVELAAPTAAARAEALRGGAAALRELGVELDAEPDDLGAALPRFTADGVAARLQVIADTCYACSVGDAGSYRAGAWVDAPVGAVAWDDDVPPLPPALLEAIAQLGDAWYGVSWGRPGPAWDEALASGD